MSDEAKVAAPVSDEDSSGDEIVAVKDATTETEGKAPSSSSPEPIPIPPTAPESGVSILAHKLWIGNLDNRLTEQNILRFTTKYGEVVSFRYLFKAGTERLEPRGYCFIEFSTREEAEKAKGALAGKKALGKKLIVDWARVDMGAKKTGSAFSETWDPSIVSSTLDSGVSTSAKIAALEAKLHQMEEEDKGVELPGSKRPRLSAKDQVARIKRRSGVERVKIVHRPISKPHQHRPPGKGRPRSVF